MMAYIKVYLMSQSNVISLISALVMYFSYAFIGDLWKNEGLLLVCLFFAVALPFISRICNKIEEKCFFSTCLVSVSRIARFAFQFCVNYMVFTIFIRYKVVSAANAQGFGGIAGVAFLTTATSQGMQYVAILFSNRGIGNVNMNVIFSLSFVTFITAMAVLGMGWIKDLFSYLGIFCAVILFLIGLASDIRSFFPPRKGIGIFLGLFNPFSKAHLKMLEQALQKRGLEKIFIHVTPILPVQANALKKGEIKIKTQSDEFTTYEKTEKADVHVDYFPTGNEFIKYEMRLFSIKEAIEGTEVENKIEIISYPEIFGKKGFHGVVAEIKRLNPLQVIHGLHGNDFDGMSVRRIYDESGWIFPYYAKVAR